MIIGIQGVIKYASCEGTSGRMTWSYCKNDFASSNNVFQDTAFIM